MTTIIKTYSRARAAVAAARKILDMHEVAANEAEIETTEPTPGRFAPMVTLFASLALPTRKLVEADLLDAGYEFESIYYDGIGLEPEGDHPDEAKDLEELESATLVALGDAAEEDAIILTETPVDMGEAMAADEEAAVAAAALEQAALAEAAAAGRKSGYVKETSTVQNATKRVWDIADSLPNASRKDVIEACRVVGIAYGTARTQYQKWFTAKKNA